MNPVPLKGTIVPIMGTREERAFANQGLFGRTRAAVLAVLYGRYFLAQPPLIHRFIRQVIRFPVLLPQCMIDRKPLQLSDQLLRPRM